MNNPDKVRYDTGKKTLYLSKIFEWYGEDFVKALRTRRKIKKKMQF